MMVSSRSASAHAHIHIAGFKAVHTHVCGRVHLVSCSQLLYLLIMWMMIPLACATNVVDLLSRAANAACNLVVICAEVNMVTVKCVRRLRQVGVNVSVLQSKNLLCKLGEKSGGPLVASA